MSSSQQGQDVALDQYGQAILARHREYVTRIFQEHQAYAESELQQYLFGVGLSIQDFYRVRRGIGVKCGIVQGTDEYWPFYIYYVDDDWNPDAGQPT